MVITQTLSNVSSSGTKYDTYEIDDLSPAQFAEFVEWVGDLRGNVTKLVVNGTSFFLTGANERNAFAQGFEKAWEIYHESFRPVDIEDGYLF